MKSEVVHSALSCAALIRTIGQSWDLNVFIVFKYTNKFVKYFEIKAFIITQMNLTLCSAQSLER